jgi:hypothetical protein
LWHLSVCVCEGVFWNSAKQRLFMVTSPLMLYLFIYSTREPWMHRKPYGPCAVDIEQGATIHFTKMLHSALRVRWGKELFQKGKAQYGWPPCQDSLFVKRKKIFLHKRHLIWTNKYKEAHHTVPSPLVRLPWMTCQCVFALSCQANQENII